MYKYKVMIIDDNIDDRRELFTKFLTNDFLNSHCKLDEAGKKLCQEKLKYELTLVSPMPFENIETFIKQNKADAYFLDVMYPENCDWNLERIISKIRIYNINAPIFVYSSAWSDQPVIETVSQAFRRAMPGRTPAYYFSLDDITVWVRNAFENKTCILDSLNQIVEERKFIIDIISKAYGKTNKVPFMNDKGIVLLHISDIQYGDANTTDYTLDLWREVERKCKELQRSGDIKGIDILVISGDIAMHGRISEYREGKEDIESLCSLLWPDEKEDKAFRERIVLVPGNHDFDLNYCAIDYYQAKNLVGERKIDFEAIREALTNENRIKSGDYHTMGLAAYRDFAYDLTGNPVFYDAPGLNFIEHNFSNWNLRFVCLNSCDGICAEKTNGVNFEKNTFSKIFNDNRNGDCYTIAVSHHSPLFKDGLTEAQKKSFFTNCNSIIRNFNVKVWLGGHRHVYHRDEVRVGGTECDVYEAPTIRLDEAWGKDEIYKILTEQGEICSTRGFEIIVINPEEEKAEPDVYKYVFDEKGSACKVKQ